MFRFVNRPMDEMDPSDPKHEAEHEEFQRELANSLQKLEELIKSAPCPGTVDVSIQVVGLFTLTMKTEFIQALREEKIKQTEQEDGLGFNPEAWGFSV